MTFDDEENKTDVLSRAEEETISTKLIEENIKTKEGETAKSSPRKSRTVPSSKTEGSVWLRYTPREPQISETDPSTES
jgi:hypothetical protein